MGRRDSLTLLAVVPFLFSCSQISVRNVGGESYIGTSRQKIDKRFELSLKKEEVNPSRVMFYSRCGDDAYIVTYRNSGKTPRVKFVPAYDSDRNWVPHGRLSPKGISFGIKRNF